MYGLERAQGIRNYLEMPENPRDLYAEDVVELQQRINDFDEEFDI